jgi:hypothetical protein
LNALATALPIEEIIREEIRESPPDRRARLELERYNLIFRAKAEAGRQALDKALHTAYPDRIPSIPNSLKGQRLSPLVTRPERTGPLTRFEHLNPVFDGTPWLVDDVTAAPFPRGTSENVPWDLRSWVNDQTHHTTDQNLFCAARYARDKMRYVPRRAGQKFKNLSESVYGDATVYSGSDGADHKDGNTAAPAGVHRENRGYGAQVLWACVDEQSLLNFPGLQVGDPIPIIAHASNSANARDWDLRMLATAAYHKLLEREDLDYLVSVSDICRMSSEDYAAKLSAAIHQTIVEITVKQLYRDPAGRYPYLSLPTNQEYAPELPEITPQHLEELKLIWNDRLKQCAPGLEHEEPERQFPIRLLKETTQYTPTPDEDVEKITDGIRLADSLGTLTPDQRQYANDIMEKIQTGDPLSDAERKRKERMLKKMTIDEAWYRAELKLREDQRVNGLYALVSLPSQAPRAYFLMGEASALPIVKQCVAANGNLSKTPYVLVRVFQAKIDAAKRAKGKDRKAVERAFLTAPIRIMAF